MALFDRILHPQVQGVLQRLTSKVQCQPEASHNDKDWTWIKASGMTSAMLFMQIEKNWSFIMEGPEERNFALIYCEHGRDAGVWLHHLKTPLDRSEYAAGIHRVQM